MKNSKTKVFAPRKLILDREAVARLARFDVAGRKAEDSVLSNCTLHSNAQLACIGR